MELCGCVDSIAVPNFIFGLNLHKNIIIDYL